jgi:hypothetical protein
MKSLLSFCFIITGFAGCQHHSNEAHHNHNHAQESSIPDTFTVGEHTYPKIGVAPNISADAIRLSESNKKLYDPIDSVVKRYKSFDAAKKHLTKSQIAFYTSVDVEEMDPSYIGSICSWYCAGGPSGMTASSDLTVLKQGDSSKVDYIHDFSLKTAWFADGKGTKNSPFVDFKFVEPSAPVTTVKIHNGYLKSDKDWKNYARVKTLQLYIDNQPHTLLELKDTFALQSFYIGTHQAHKEDMHFKFEIKSIYIGEKYDQVAISELEFDGTGGH